METLPLTTDSQKLIRKSFPELSSTDEQAVREYLHRRFLSPPTPFLAFNERIRTSHFRGYCVENGIAYIHLETTNVPRLSELTTVDLLIPPAVSPVIVNSILPFFEAAVAPEVARFIQTFYELRDSYFEPFLDPYFLRPLETFSEQNSPLSVCAFRQQDWTTKLQICSQIPVNLEPWNALILSVPRLHLADWVPIYRTDHNLLILSKHGQLAWMLFFEEAFILDLTLTEYLEIWFTHLPRDGDEFLSIMNATEIALRIPLLRLDHPS